MLPCEYPGKIPKFWSDKSEGKKQNDVDKELKKKQCQAIDFAIVYTGFLL